MGIQGIQSIYKKPFVYSLTPRTSASGSTWLSPDSMSAAGTPGTYKGSFLQSVSRTGVFYLYFAYPKAFGDGPGLSAPQGYDTYNITKSLTGSWNGLGTSCDVVVAGRIIPFWVFRTDELSNSTTNFWNWSWTVT